MRLSFLLITCFISIISTSQDYTSWFTGDTSDVNSSHIGGIVLAGGGGDNDDAMTWMLNRANGGDVVVIRASGSDGYNTYFYTDLGVAVNSVETILINSVAAANDPYVEQQIRNAEVLFIAGGDQYDYYSYWKDGPVENAINYLINDKGATVGGTSAGMAILGKTYYAPDGEGVVSSEALTDPYHDNMSIIGRDDFINVELLNNTVADTHFDDRDRAGRSMTFLARMETDWGVNAFGIACNEYTAVCIDTTGIAYVYGEHPSYPDYAYFLQSNCDNPGSEPETCVSGNPLHWVKNNDAVKAYRIGGTTDGSRYLDLNDWTTGNGGEWFDWYVISGVLYQMGDAEPPCVSYTQEIQPSNLIVYPNPSEHFLKFNISISGSIIDISGRLVYCFDNKDSINISSLEPGIYTLITNQDNIKFVKQ